MKGNQSFDDRFVKLIVLILNYKLQGGDRKPNPTKFNNHQTRFIEKVQYITPNCDLPIIISLFFFHFCFFSFRSTDDLLTMKYLILYGWEKQIVGKTNDKII